LFCFSIAKTKLPLLFKSTIEQLKLQATPHRIFSIAEGYTFDLKKTLKHILLKELHKNRIP